MKRNTYYINLLTNRGNLYQNLNGYLMTDNGDGYSKAIQIIVNRPALNKEFKRHFFPQQILFDYPYYLDALSLEKILLWYSNLLVTYKDQIIELNMLKNEIEKCILSGKYEDAIKKCDETKDKYGFSAWLLDCYSLIETFDSNSYDFKKCFSKDMDDFYNTLSLKNRRNEKQHQYVHRLNHMLSSLNEQTRTYYKYKLFSELPTLDRESNILLKWKYLLIFEGGLSLFDIYLIVVDCMQWLVSLPRNEHPKKLDSIIGLISQIDTELCQLIKSIYHNTPIHSEDDIEENKIVQLITNEKYSDVLNEFFKNGDIYFNSFGAYRYAAISQIHLNEENDKKGFLAKEIFDCICNILKKDNSDAVYDAFTNLRIISRIFRSFTIHKGICLFLNVTFNINMGYNFIQQISTYDDEKLFLYEMKNDIPSLLPYRALLVPEEKKEKSLLESSFIETYQERIDKGIATNYYKTALLKTQVNELVKKNQIVEAICRMVHSHIENEFTLYTIDVTQIRDFLNEKIKGDCDIGLEELCFIFIDDYFMECRKSCFLNYLDNESLDEPLDILKIEKYEKDIVWFFLGKICSIDMLTCIYMLFDSSDETVDYRMEICKHIIKETDEDSREYKKEIEALAKNKAMKDRLIGIDKSRVSINTDSIKKSVYEDIGYQVDACSAQIPEQFVCNTKGKVLYVDFKDEAYTYMYERYARAFCFGINGLDTSLSTRVRHGTLINQILRPFSDYNLIYSETSRNDFFDSLFENNKLKEEIKALLVNLQKNLESELDYFTKHTLKVFIDEPIEGAVFDYSKNAVDMSDLSTGFWFRTVFSTAFGKNNSVAQNTNSTIDDLHNLMIQKTDEYLKSIRDIYLPRLEERLVNLLDEFEKSSKDYVMDKSTNNEIRRRITRCKTAIQTEFKTVEGWFYLSESEVWANYKFEDLLEMCLEISKKLFSNFERVQIKRHIHDDTTYEGKTFGYLTDVLLILLNNAFSHSGFDDTPQDLIVEYTVKTDNDYIYMTVENNVNNSTDFAILKDRLSKINENYKSGAYKKMNTRLEGGMGLYKIMNILFNNSNREDSFNISLDNDIVKVELKFKKELFVNEENIIS